MSNPLSSPAWLALQQHASRFTAEGFRLDSLFLDAPDRADRFSVELPGLFYDYSRHFIDSQTLALLDALGQEAGLADAIDAMFRGDAINNTEKRPALHVALRAPLDEARPEVAETRQKMRTFCEAVISGQWLGYSGKEITDVVNLGIGGSDLGPHMMVEALHSHCSGKPRVHFVSNVDPCHLDETLASLDPASTLFIVASKSFTTLETHQNAQRARAWLLAASGDAAATSRHFVACSTNLEAVREFGIDPANVFPMWDWVGGRYSLWSAIGLPVALAIGPEKFEELLAGAWEMDCHFRDAATDRNIPVISALLSVYYRALFGASSTAVLPYSQHLELLPGFLQQLSMESLGKRVTREGNPTPLRTGDVIWGSSGTNGQHSYFQLLHQGTEFIPADFIAVVNSPGGAGGEAHQHLLANCLAQGLAMMSGTPDENDSHRLVPGNKPSSTLLLKSLDPRTMGLLVALYEHKVYAQSVLLGINAFDQWGVELGKKLSRSLFSVLTGDDGGDPGSLDSSTGNLVRRTRAWQD